MSEQREPFAVLYRWSVEPGHEEAFVERWREGTQALRDEHGGLGSCLSRDENGDFVAFARWQSEEARAAAFEARGPRPPMPGVVRFEEVRLRVIADLLTTPK